jgi:helicase
MQAWSESGNCELVAEQLSVYPGEVIQLRDTCLRLTAVLIGLLDHMSADQASMDSDTSELKRKLRRLEIMIRCGLNDDNATLTMVSGIGAKWARKLALAGISDIEELAQTEAEAITTLGGISQSRAEKWIEEASIQLKSEEFFVATDSARHVLVRQTNIDFSVDVYRLKRSWQLEVLPLETPLEFIVKGGSDPHRIDTSMMPWRCDCADHAKGHECKHLIAVRRWHKDTLVLSMDAALLQQESARGINLKKWWAQ